MCTINGMPFRAPPCITMHGPLNVKIKDT